MLSFSRGPGPPEDELAQFLREAEEEYGARIKSIVIQPCCRDDGFTCLHMDVAQCSDELEKETARLVALAKSSPVLARSGFRLSLWFGKLGRGQCRDPKAACVPQPYDRESAQGYDPNGNRYLRSDPAKLGSEHQCQNDGDCFISGCHNVCLSFLDSPVIGLCNASTEMTGFYCGCVLGACRWFEQ